MPFSISGNLDKIDPAALVKFQKHFGLILSENHFEKQQYTMILDALRHRHNYILEMAEMTKKEIMSLIFILSQFGDIVTGEAPGEFTDFRNIPYILEWSPNVYMVPREVLDFLGQERVFKDQNYLFALLPSLPVKEKKAWIKWLATDYEGNSEKDLNHEIYKELRLLQKPYMGKSLIQETSFSLSKIWKPGDNKIVDWFYKGLTPFYFAMQELSQTLKDPFLLHVVEMIKSGKYILKKEPDKFREKENYKLVLTVEGSSIQFRESIFHWEVEKKKSSDYLFQNLQ